MLAITVFMALISLMALAATMAVCYCKTRSKKAPDLVYYSSTSERATTEDPAYEDIDTLGKDHCINTQPNEAYHPVAVGRNVAYETQVVSVN